MLELELSLSSSEDDEDDELELLEESEAKPVLMFMLMFSALFARSGSTSYQNEDLKKTSQLLISNLPSELAAISSKTSASL